MAHNWLILLPARLHFVMLTTLALIACSACNAMSETTYSIEEQYNLSAARSVRAADQLQFSIKLVLDHVPFEQDIFFTATFSNTTGQPVVFMRFVRPQFGDQLEFRIEQLDIARVIDPPANAGARSSNSVQGLRL